MRFLIMIVSFVRCSVFELKYTANKSFVPPKSSLRPERQLLCHFTLRVVPITKGHHKESLFNSSFNLIPLLSIVQYILAILPLVRPPFPRALTPGLHPVVRVQPGLAISSAVAVPLPCCVQSDTATLPIVSAE